MYKKIFKLNIDCSDGEQFSRVRNLLNLNRSKKIGYNWILEIEEYKDEPNFDFVKYFFKILDGNFDELSRIRVSRQDISFWILYQYESQSNLEFCPEDLKK